MTAKDKETTDLLSQHQAIKAHMKFLTKALKKLTAQSAGTKGKSTRLEEQIRLYRWSLYDFQEAIKRHIELDDQIFRTLHDRGTLEQLSREHEEIKKLIDDVVRQAENTVYNPSGREELKQSADNIKEAVKEICQSCQAHMTKEDALLKTPTQES
jgi:predicted  nucleic acid-binding Zn-ribbon protein